MNKSIIIAEAGVNHNGDIETAKRLIDVAADAGVDYVKFQTFKANKIVTKQAKRANYQNKNTKDLDTQYEMLKKLELNEDSHHVLIKYCNHKGIKFLSTGFDLDSLEFLHKIGIRLAKIPSGEITNLPYLRKISELFPEVILSTGMSNIEEVREAVEVLLKNGLNKENLTLLHCNSDYPTQMEDVNLNAMLHLKREFGVKVGYSDHTLGIEVPIAAVALGAKLIEKHFTLDRNLPGPDHRASLEPIELKDMVSTIRNIEKAISGNGIKKPTLSEKKNIYIVRKSIHLSRELKTGHIITDKDIIALRPGDGICAMNWDDVIGKKVRRDLKEYTKLTLNDLF